MAAHAFLGIDVGVPLKSRRTLRLDDLLSAILVLQFQGSSRAVRPQPHVCLFRVRGAAEDQYCALLRRADFDSRTPALSDQPEQHGLRVTLTILLSACRHHIEACPNPTPLIDNFERTTSQHRGDAIGPDRPELVRRNIRSPRLTTVRVIRSRRTVSPSSRADRSPTPRAHAQVPLSV